MEIELVTTKKKLTLSLVKQMSPLSKYVDMTRCKVLGHFQHPGITKGMKTAIIQFDGEYYTLALYCWEKLRDNTVRAQIKNANTRKLFKDTQTRDTWLELFELIKTKALATHIYL